MFTASALYLPSQGDIIFTDGTPYMSVLFEDGKLKPRLEQFSNLVIEVLKLVDGINHLECFETPANEIVMCEIAARLRGGGIVQMIELQFGINYSRTSSLLLASRGNLIELQNRPQDKIFGIIRMVKIAMSEKSPPSRIFQRI